MWGVATPRARVVRGGFGRECRMGTSASLGGGGFGGAGEPAQVGSPPSAHGGRGWHIGKGAAMVALHLLCHSTMVPCFYCGLGFFHNLSQLWSSLVSSLQAVSSQPTAVPSLGPCSKLHIPAPRLPLQQETHDSGWSAQGCGTDHPRRSYSVLPGTEQLLHFPPMP